MSILGGQKTASGASSTLSCNRLSWFSVIEKIENYKKHSSNRYQYIGKIENRKIFERKKIDDIPMNDAFIRVRESSSNDHRKGNIYETTVLRIFMPNVIVYETDHKNERHDLEKDSLYRKRKGHSGVVCKLDAENISNKRKVSEEVGSEEFFLKRTVKELL